MAGWRTETNHQDSCRPTDLPSGWLLGPQKVQVQGEWLLLLPSQAPLPALTLASPLYALSALLGSTLGSPASFCLPHSPVAIIRLPALGAVLIEAAATPS